MLLRRPVRDRLMATVSGLPRLVQSGGALVVAGGLVDIVYHTAPATAGSEAMALSGHTVTLAGMAVAMVGVIRTGLAQRHRQPR